MDEDLKSVLERAHGSEHAMVHATLLGVQAQRDTIRAIVDHALAVDGLTDHVVTSFERLDLRMSDIENNTRPKP